jgi:aspartyl-tRNA(Asn)/glutamyl-tRNA(Gln) amidotransferase subunit A
LEDLYESTRSAGFNAENKRRIMTGAYVLSSGYYDAYYKKAMTVRTKLIETYKEAVSKYDVLIGPTAPTTAFKLGANVDDPLAMYLTDVLTVTANLVGAPAISIPAGLADGLPVGLQIMSGMGKDKQLLDAAAAMSEVIHG